MSAPPGQTWFCSLLNAQGLEPPRSGVWLLLCKFWLCKYSLNYQLPGTPSALGDLGEQDPGWPAASPLLSIAPPPTPWSPFVFICVISITLLKITNSDLFTCDLKCSTYTYSVPQLSRPFCVCFHALESPRGCPPPSFSLSCLLASLYPIWLRKISWSFWELWSSQARP